MASDNEASCESDPNFAVICAFMEKFGTTCGLQSIDFLELQEMLENTQEVPQELIDLHIKLLRKSRKSVCNERWERAIIKFCHTFCIQDAWEIERFGYKKARISSKLRVLKELLEMQFDYNARFKAEINKMSAEELRSQPLGKDKQGHAYWFQNDNNCQIRVYKEDPDEETWTLVARDRDGLASLISELNDGDSKISTESGINEEDSNSLAEKPIIDTGQVDSSSESNKKSPDSDSNESKEKEENISSEEENFKDGNGNTKRKRESDEESIVKERKKTKNEVSEAIEENVMIVRGEGSGEENEAKNYSKSDENIIVSEEIEEDVMFFFGEGQGEENQTGNEDKEKQEVASSSTFSISDSNKYCVSEDVPTSPVKTPYKLGTIIDTKTDNKFFSSSKSPMKKSRWDVETIIAKEPDTGKVQSIVNKCEQMKETEEVQSPKKSQFFFGPGCLQHKPITFGQKVPSEQCEEGHILPENKEETKQIVETTSVQTHTPKDETKGPNLMQIEVEKLIITENTVVENIEMDQKIPEVTATLMECDKEVDRVVDVEMKDVCDEEKQQPVVEEPCVKEAAYLLGIEKKGTVVEDCQQPPEASGTDENENKQVLNTKEEETSLRIDDLARSIPLNSEPQSSLTEKLVCENETKKLGESINLDKEEYVSSVQQILEETKSTEKDTSLLTEECATLEPEENESIASIQEFLEETGYTNKEKVQLKFADVEEGSESIASIQEFLEETKPPQKHTTQEPVSKHLSTELEEGVSKKETAIENEISEREETTRLPKEQSLVDEEDLKDKSKDEENISETLSADVDEDTSQELSSKIPKCSSIVEMLNKPDVPSEDVDATNSTSSFVPVVNNVMEELKTDEVKMLQENSLDQKLKEGNFAVEEKVVDDKIKSNDVVRDIEDLNNDDEFRVESKDLSQTKKSTGSEGLKENEELKTGDTEVVTIERLAEREILNKCNEIKEQSANLSKSDELKVKDTDTESIQSKSLSIDKEPKAGGKDVFSTENSTKPESLCKDDGLTVEDKDMPNTEKSRKDNESKAEEDVLVIDKSTEPESLNKDDDRKVENEDVPNTEKSRKDEEPKAGERDVLVIDKSAEPESLSKDDKLIAEGEDVLNTESLSNVEEPKAGGKGVLCIDKSLNKDDTLVDDENVPNTKKSRKSESSSNDEEHKARESVASIDKSTELENFNKDDDNKDECNTETESLIKDDTKLKSISEIEKPRRLSFLTVKSFAKESFFLDREDTDKEITDECVLVEDEDSTKTSKTKQDLPISSKEALTPDSPHPQIEQEEDGKTRSTPKQDEGSDPKIVSNKVEQTKQTENKVKEPVKRGRKKKNLEPTETDEKKPCIATRRTLRSSKVEEAELVPTKPVEATKKGKRGRAPRNKATKEDADKAILPQEETEEKTTSLTEENTKKVDVEEDKRENVEVVSSKDDKLVEENKTAVEEEKIEGVVDKAAEKEQETAVSSPGSDSSNHVPEAVIVEDSSSGDIMEITEKDPLAASDEEKKTQQAKPMSLTSFSLDFHESPTPTPTPPRRTLRKRGHESAQNSEDNEESSVKRLKIKAKRVVDVKLRKSIEEQKKKELVSSDEEQKVSKKGKKVNESKKEDSIVLSSDNEKEKEPKPKKKRKNANQRLLMNLGIDPSQILGYEAETGVRQSRRIAQIKIKEEAERRKLEEEMAHEVEKKKKVKKIQDKDYKGEKKKPKEGEEEAAEEDSTDSKKRKKKRKKHRLFDESNPWRSSSDSSSSNEEDEMGEEEEEEYEDVLQYVSDHEFSPESDMEGDEDALPLKRARTVKKESDVEEEIDDLPCQKCGKCDHPEWILLCDNCDNGWHCSCLRPPLLVIPEGDWFCPPCQHATLLSKLQDKLREYDKILNKKQIEDRRKERLAYVGISLNNVLPAKEGEPAKAKKKRGSKSSKKGSEDETDNESSSSDESESGSDSASDSDEPIYQLRQRRQAHSYRFNDYDELINSAIQDEMDAVKGAGNQGRGKDIATIVNAEKEEERKKEAESQEQSEEPAEPEPLPPVVPVNDRDKEARPVFDDDDDVRVKKKIIGRKKHRKLNALDISSEDDHADSDEDFKGTSSESDDDFDEDLGSDDSDLETGRNRRKGFEAVRRSTRARTSRYDADFIDDGDSESSEEAPRRKKKRSIWDESESEESDRSWGRRKRKPTGGRTRRQTNPLNKKKKSKKKKKQQDSDEDVYKKKKPKIKFGFDAEDEGPVRRTRGKKINYVDALGSDSDDDRGKRPPPRIESDEEYVANEEDVAEDEKISEEEAEAEENEDNVNESRQKQKEDKIQIQSYTDANFTKLLPEPDLKGDEIESELNPIDQINRNVEMMDENEMEKMMEEEEYANKQLQMVAQQLEKEKKRKEREAKKAEQSLPNQIEDDCNKKSNKTKKKEHFTFTASMQEPLVGNVDNLLLNSDNNDELSEPPGVSLPLFAELGNSGEAVEEAKKKRRGRSKKSLEETVANLGTSRQAKTYRPTDLSTPANTPNIEIAAPPQPFNQPTPSVITRMLQTKAGNGGQPPPAYPVGSIRPKQFAAMVEREEERPPPPQYVQGSPSSLRSQLSSPYRQQMPSSPSHNHFPRGPPPPIRNPVPHMYHAVPHRSLDPSPSGGGTINPEHHGSPNRVVSPAAGSPGGSGKADVPPPYSRAAPPAGNRFPPRPQTQPPPLYHGSGGGMVPSPYYGNQFAPHEEAMNVYQNSPYEEPTFDGGENKYEEESGGEFGGLVSYFSSQREDDLES